MVFIHSLQSHRSTCVLQLLAVVTWDIVASVASSSLWQYSTKNQVSVTPETTYIETSKRKLLRRNHTVLREGSYFSGL